MVLRHQQVQGGGLTLVPSSYLVTSKHTCFLGMQRRIIHILMQGCSIIINQFVKGSIRHVSKDKCQHRHAAEAPASVWTVGPVEKLTIITKMLQQASSKRSLASGGWKETRRQQTQKNWSQVKHAVSQNCHSLLPGADVVHVALCDSFTFMFSFSYCNVLTSLLAHNV